MKKASSSSVSSIFSSPLTPNYIVEDVPQDSPRTDLDELEIYLALPHVQDMDIDVLQWWQARDHNKGADASTGRPEGLPTLAKPHVQDMDIDVLQWWQARDHNKGADASTGRPEGLPTLAKMARQYLGRPTSSAGVERAFSKAGKLHDGLKAAQCDDTLEHALLAGANSL